jgi:6,7-dimethyl-8-ribityllumazine synthase
MARYDNIHEYEPVLTGQGLTVGIVMSRFNQDVCEGLLGACTAELKHLGVADSKIVIATVPGALEIPLVLQTMAQSNRFEVVSNDSSRALMEVQLHTGVPIANGVLTCEDDDQALARMQEKGADCARTAVEMANLLRALGEKTQ